MPRHPNIASDLKELVDGEVLDREWQRAMYSADSSIYEVLPLCVVVPKTEADVVKTIRYASERRIPVTARGGGTSLAGQTVNSGIVIDFSKHLNRVLEVDTAESYVIVEPGVNKTELDIYLEGSGCFFPPDPSSSDFCTIGGMIANNSSGPHTVKYGSVIDYILSLRVVLSNGEVIETRPVKIGDEEWRRIVEADTLEAKIYREAGRLLQENQDTIRERAPTVRKNCSGYQLHRLLQDGVIDLGRILAASEGTLGIILQAKLRILRTPESRGTAMLQFDSLEKMGAAVAKILALKPSAVELIDNHVLDLAANAYPELRRDVPKDAKALLLIEFDGASRKEVKKGLKRLEDTLVTRSDLTLRAGFAYTSSEAERFWTLRKKSLPYVMKMRRNGRRPTPFIEDVVVHPDQLPSFIQQLYDIFRKHDVDGVVYGHAGDGQLHTRPLLNLKTEADINVMTKIADEVFYTVTESGGSITGEHGDGLIRSQYVQTMFGDDVYHLFKEIRTIFDPNDILNPGRKITDDPTVWRRNFRYGPSYRRRPIQPALNWSINGNRLREQLTGFPDELGYGDEVELCHGCGNCREVTPGRMCPVFKAYRNEVNSCRGRLSILRWLLKADGLPTGFEETEEYGRIVFDNCVQCKMCLIECPSNVNVGKLMAEARARYSTQRGVPQGYGFFADIDRYAELGSRFSPFSNLLLRNVVFRRFLEWNSGIDRRRPFPRFSRKTFVKRFQEHRQRESKDTGRSVVFFYDTFINYVRPDFGILIVKILERNGYTVLVPPQRSSGLSALIEGSPDAGRKMAEYNIINLAPYVEREIPIVTFSPSSGVALKIEYLNVIDTPEARRVAGSTFDIHEFLYRLYQKGELADDFRPIEREIYLHLHCHDLVQQIERDVTGLLGLLPGLKFEVLERGCCGVGGAFGFVKGNYKRSLQIGSPLLKAVRSADRAIYSTGESCILQMEAGTGRRIGLTMDLLGEAYGLS